VGVVSVRDTRPRVLLSDAHADPARTGDASTPVISVVIPTFNRLPRLQRVLAALAEQTVPEDAFEVVVVSDGSTDGTDAYLTSGATPVTVRAISQPNQGPAAARNAGVDAAVAELVLFLDDDVVPTPALVERHLAAHRRHGGDVVVLGPMLTPADHDMSPWVAYEQAMLYKQYDAMCAGVWAPTARQFYTGNASLARHHVLEAGGFDTDFVRAEDVELGYRLAARGLDFIFDPEAAGNHYAERSYASWQRTPYLYGRNAVIFARERGQRWLVPVIREDFARHHPLLRTAVRATIDRPRLRRALLRGCELIVRVGAGRLHRAALSVVFNITYYEGVTDEFGSSRWLLGHDGEHAIDGHSR
jgi:GT2 family glycosyltransferase